MQNKVNAATVANSATTNVYFKLLIPNFSALKANLLQFDINKMSIINL